MVPLKWYYFFILPVKWYFTVCILLCQINTKQGDIAILLKERKVFVSCTIHLSAHSLFWKNCRFSGLGGPITKYGEFGPPKFSVMSCQILTGSLHLSGAIAIQTQFIYALNPRPDLACLISRVKKVKETKQIVSSLHFNEDSWDKTTTPFLSLPQFSSTLYMLPLECLEHIDQMNQGHQKAKNKKLKWDGVLYEPFYVVDYIIFCLHFVVVEILWEQLMTSDLTSIICAGKQMSPVGVRPLRIPPA